jgi:hypothetical protein
VVATHVSKRRAICEGWGCCELAVNLTARPGHRLRWRAICKRSVKCQESLHVEREVLFAQAFENVRLETNNGLSLRVELVYFQLSPVVSAAQSSKA